MVHTQLFTEKPDCTARLSKEERVYDLLQRLEISYTGVDHEDVYKRQVWRSLQSPAQRMFG